MAKQWLVVELEHLARFYTSRSDFKKHEPMAYEAALRRGIIARLFPVDKRVKYTEQGIREAAKAYKNLADLRAKNPALYAAAHRRLMTGELFVDTFVPDVYSGGSMSQQDS